MRSVRVLTIGVAALSAVAVYGAGPTGAAPDGSGKPPSNSPTGTGLVFKVNPVQSSGDQSLTDQKDAAGAVPANAYARVVIRNLDGSGYLSGKWANVRTETGNPAYSITNTFDFDRRQDEFEQTMAYFWINQAQEYLQSLGFGSTLPAVLKRPFDVRINQSGADNSYMWSKHNYIRLGKGGVDDAEDAEVIVHEYGHAVHHDQVTDFGTSFDAGAIGESFGDYLAVTVGLDAAKDYGWPVAAEANCPMDWDAVSYTSAPHCIRRFDTNRTVATMPSTWGIHSAGQIWSQALWEIRQGYVAQGKTTEAWDATLIASQFDYAPDTTWSAAAKATYDVALARDGQAAANLVKARFAARGITF